MSLGPNLLRPGLQLLSTVGIRHLDKAGELVLLGRASAYSQKGHEGHESLGWYDACQDRSQRRSACRNNTDMDLGQVPDGETTEHGDGIRRPQTQACLDVDVGFGHGRTHGPVKQYVSLAATSGL